MLFLTKEQIERIFNHVKKNYPYETCGILLGHKEDAAKRVFKIVEANNLNRERAHDRYDMDPRDFYKADVLARDEGLEILGFYHSHPDHPAAPSVTDKQKAWNGYSYVIISVKGGGECLAKSFVLENPEEDFKEEKILFNAKGA